MSESAKSLTPFVLRMATAEEIAKGRVLMLGEKERIPLVPAEVLFNGVDPDIVLYSDPGFIDEGKYFIPCKNRGHGFNGIERVFKWAPGKFGKVESEDITHLKAHGLSKGCVIEFVRQRIRAQDEERERRAQKEKVEVAATREEMLQRTIGEEHGEVLDQIKFPKKRSKKKEKVESA